jgi:3-hydroxybutyryl-CoA dehydrogenase
MNKKKVCVVGIGTMGSGIVQTCAQAGYDVSVVYKTEEAFEEGFGTIKKDLSRLVKKERIEQAEVDRLLDAIRAKGCGCCNRSGI